MFKGIEKIQLNKKQANGLFYLSLVMLGFFAFIFLGSQEPVLFDDSGAYLRVKRIEGVMPVYPLFLLINQYLFGNDSYLQIVIVEQALLANACVILFVKVIKDKFSLKYWESYLVFGLSLIPFTMDMPQAMTTQEILTEGIAYALFYLFMILLLQTVWTKRFMWLMGAYVMTLVLAMVRSQLQILFGVCGIVFLYIVCARGRYYLNKHIIARSIFGVLGCIIISLAGIFLISRITFGYKDIIRNNDKFSAFIMKVQSPEEYQEYLQEKTDENVHQDSGVEMIKENNIKRQLSVEELANKSFSPSQYVSLIFSRGMYEADLEDAGLFEDELLRELFLELYRAVDAEQQRYVYAQNGLWMWKDIVGGIGRIGKTCLAVPSEYYVAYYPDIILSDNFSDTRNAHLQEIGITLLKAHLGRFLYHTLMLLPSAFICTVFFQIAPIYGLCHLVTLILYASAAALMIWGYADSRVERKYAEFMALVLGVNVVMVVIISLVFFGQQRYLVYNFGIFYVAYGLLLQKLWKCRLKGWVHSRISRKADLHF